MASEPQERARKPRSTTKKTKAPAKSRAKAKPKETPPAEEPVGVRSARDIRFIRKGVAGDWRSELNPESAQLIVRRYEGLMASLGYETATGEPAR